MTTLNNSLISSLYQSAERKALGWAATGHKWGQKMYEVEFDFFSYTAVILKTLNI